MIKINLLSPKIKNIIQDAQPCAREVRSVEIPAYSEIVRPPQTSRTIACMTVSQTPARFDVDGIFAEIIIEVSKRHPRTSMGCVWTLERAFNLNRDFFGAETLPNGEPKVYHNLRVAKSLAELGLSPLMISTFLLSSFSEVKLKEAGFGQTIIRFVKKLGHFRAIPYEEKNMNRKKVFLNLLVKEFGLGLHLIEAMEELETLRIVAEGVKLDNVRRDYARRAHDISAPFLRRLNFKKLAEELEDLALRYLDPIAYETAAKKIRDQVKKNRFKARKENIELAGKIQGELAKKNILASSESHIKSVSKAMEKMARKETDALNDTFRQRYIVSNIHDCYKAERVITNYLCSNGWESLPALRDNYINSPKEKTGYKSLHIYFKRKSDGLILEIQIRTWEMDFRAQFDGYHETFLPEEIERPITPLKIFRTWRSLLKNNVYVFDQDGILYELTPFPINKKPTVIDLAFARGTIGAHTLKTFIKDDDLEWKEIKFEAPLETGRTYKIVPSTDVFPSREWLKYAATLQAQIQLKSQFKQKMTKILFNLGQEKILDMLEDFFSRQVRKVGLVMGKEKSIEREHKTINFLPVIAWNLGLTSIDELCIAVGIFEDEKEHGQNEIIREIIEKLEMVYTTIMFSSEEIQAGGSPDISIILPRNPEILSKIAKVFRIFNITAHEATLETLENENILLRLTVSTNSLSFNSAIKYLRKMEERFKFIVNEYFDTATTFEVTKSELFLKAIEVIACAGGDITEIKTLKNDRGTQRIFKINFRIPKNRNKKKFIKRIEQEMRPSPQL